jgi:hypothetical protein
MAVTSNVGRAEIRGFTAGVLVGLKPRRRRGEPMRVPGPRVLPSGIVAFGERGTLDAEDGSVRVY